MKYSSSFSYKSIRLGRLNICAQEKHISHLRNYCLLYDPLCSRVPQMLKAISLSQSSAVVTLSVLGCLKCCKQSHLRNHLPDCCGDPLCSKVPQLLQAISLSQSSAFMTLSVLGRLNCCKRSHLCNHLPSL